MSRECYVECQQEKIQDWIQLFCLRAIFEAVLKRQWKNPLKSFFPHEKHTKKKENSDHKFVEEEKPFGIPLKEKRSHNRISFGDLIQLADKTYMANKVGIKEIIIIE